MRLRSKFAVVTAVVIFLVAAFATVALAKYGTSQTVALQVGEDHGNGYAGSYGSEIVLAPASMTSIMLPSDKFTFQVYVEDTTTDTVTGARQWKWLGFQDFEDIQLDDTNTVLPFVYQLGVDDKVILSDGSSVSPLVNGAYRIRCEYKPFGNSSVVDPTETTPTLHPNPSFSEEETVTVLKNTSTRVAISTSGAIRHSGTTFHFQVSPNCGVGEVRVVVKHGSKTTTKTLVTNENGFAGAKLKLGNSNGNYKVSAKFLGNMFGSASPYTSRSVRARR